MAGPPSPFIGIKVSNPPFKVVQVLSPKADRFASTPDTRVLNLGNYSKCLFIINFGANSGGTGRVAITAYADNIVLNQDDAYSKVGKVAIGYFYKSAVGSTPDQEGSWKRIEAGSEVNLAAANCVETQCLISIDPTEVSGVMEAASQLGGAVHLSFTTSGGAIVGSVTAIISGWNTSEPNAFMS